MERNSMTDPENSDVASEVSSPTQASKGKPSSDSLFSESDYTPFMLGVFLIGGLIGIPVLYGFRMDLTYLDSLPWALVTCVMILIAFRRNGSISWWRAIPAMAAIAGGAAVYTQSTGKPSFVAGGFFGIVLVMVCGYVGIGIKKLLKR